LLHETAAAVAGISAIGHDAENLEDLRRLDRIRKQLSDLDEYEEQGPPWNLRWGLYKGDRINRAARNVMLSRLTPMLMQPTVKKIEGYLDQGTLDDRFWEMGPIYLTLTQRLDSAGLDVRELIKQANYVWGMGRDETWTDDFRDPASELIRYWWKHHGLLGNYALAKNTAVFERVKRMIRDNYDMDRVYADLISEANRSLRDIELADLVTGSVLTGATVVPGAYTVAGWEAEVQQRIRDSRAHIEKDAFKLEALAGELDGIEEYLFRKYVSQYKRAWQEFLDGMEVSRFTDISRAVDGLGELSDPEHSAIVAVLVKAAENSIIVRDGQPCDDLWREFEGINRFFGRDEITAELPEKPSTRRESYAKLLSDAQGVLDKGGSELEGEQDCGRSLRQIANDLADGKRDAEALMRSGSSALSRAAGDLLGRPFAAAQSAAFANACACLDAAWQKAVYERFQEDLGDKYPFNKHGSEADPADLVAFFGRGGALDKFHEDEADPANRAGMQLPGSYTQAVRQGGRIRDIISGNGFSVSFVLIAESPRFGSGLESATFKFGADRPFEYRMGGTREQRFTWTGAEQECSISIDPSSGSQPAPLREAGPWSLFRLVDRGEIDGSTIAWSLRNRHDVQYKLSGPNADFIVSGGFIFSCPGRICGGG
jgi:type VI protein secretion system component VasK